MRRRAERAPPRSALALIFLLGAGILVTWPPFLQGQAAGFPSALPVSFAGEMGPPFPLAVHRGYPALPAGTLRSLGWRTEDQGTRVFLRHRTGIQLTFVPGSPYFDWDGETFQMAQIAYRFGDELHVPLQLVVDLLPGLLPRAYEWDQERGILRVAERPGRGLAEMASESDVSEGPSPTATPDPSLRARAPRVVVIDPGHGGDDPGAVGPGGTQEKEVALAVGLALAQLLEEDPELEVLLTRDRDLLVPIWERGAQATNWRGVRPGVFVSIHANALPGRPGVRGFETYFLSEARTEHERRVAAAENAPLLVDGGEDGFSQPQDPLLAGILRDLRTFDHQHWSALFADLVQRELRTFHPGPDRGVKQGPFAVITNALMPSVLVEVGFLTHREEEQLLAHPDFHGNTAAALARAIREFFERYPAGTDR